MKGHERMETDEVIERYVRRRLPDPERRALEEHLLDCAVCFERVQEMEKFVAGVRYAAEAGLLHSYAPVRRWMVPAFACAFSVVLAAAGAWIWTARKSIEALSRDRVALLAQLDQTRSEAARKPPDLRAAALPLAVLDATRAGNPGAEITAPAGTPELALWIQLDPRSADRGLGVRVSDRDGHTIALLNALEKNRYGALTISIPAASFPPGDYNVVVFRGDNHATLGQYVLKVAGK